MYIRNLIIAFIALILLSMPTIEAKTTKVSASWYGLNDGSKECTANGAEFDVDNPNLAAHKKWEFGTRALLTNPANGKKLCVEVQDRGPYIDNRDIDLTKEGAQALGMVEVGVAKLIVEKKQCFIPARWIVKTKQRKCGFTQVSWAKRKN